MLSEQVYIPLKPVLTAFTIALVVLVLFILPAEYDIDPTGIGAKLGLTVFHQDDTAAQATTHSVAKKAEGKKDVITVTLPADGRVEYKLAMDQYQKVTYEWETDKGELFFDLHGEPEGDTTGYFESYAIATLPKMKGSFTAPYTGSHGWYWRNKTDHEINIQLTIEGEYEILGLKK